MSSSRDTGKAAGPKVLRIGIVQRGKIIEEREVKKRETVTIGSSSRCTFQVASEALPKSFDLFEYDGKSYFLRFDKGIEGRVQLDDEQVADFKTLQARGHLVERSGKSAVKLSDQSRGKVMVGDVTVLFQFKTMTPAPVRPVLPADVRGSFLHNIDTQFAAIFVVVAITCMSVISYARSLPYVEPTSIADLSEEYQKLIMPDRIPEPPREPEVKEDKGEKDKKKEAKKPAKKAAAKKKAGPKKKVSPEDAAKAEAARKEAMRKRVAKIGVLGALSAGGSEEVNDVFSEGGVGSRIDSALSGTMGLELADGTGGGGARGGDVGGEVGVGNLGTEGGGAVKRGKKREARVAGRISDEAPEVDGSLDSASIRKVMNRKKGGIKACYENALKRDRGLKGKLVISFEIDERGRISNVSFGGSMRSRDVQNCIKRISRSWRFPRPEGGPVFVDYPVVFSPAG